MSPLTEPTNLPNTTFLGHCWRDNLYPRRIASHGMTQHQRPDNIATPSECHHKTLWLAMVGTLCLTMRQSRPRPIAPRQTQTTTHAQSYNLRTGSQAHYTTARRSDTARVVSNNDARHFVGGDVDRIGAKRIFPRS